MISAGGLDLNSIESGQLLVSIDDAQQLVKSSFCRGVPAHRWVASSTQLLKLDSTGAQGQLWV